MEEHMQASVEFVRLPVEEDYAYVCVCGSCSWHILLNGEIECTACGERELLAQSKLQ